MSVRISPFLAAFILLTSVDAHAQLDYQGIGTQIWTQTTGPRVSVSNDGRFANNIEQGRAGGIFTRSRPVAFLFGAGLWFGAKKRVKGLLREFVVHSYNTDDGATWMTPGDAGIIEQGRYPALIQNSVWHNPQSGASAIDTIEPWQLWAPLGSTPTMAMPGEYVATVSNRTTALSGVPAFVPGVDEQIVTRYHDGDTSRYADSIVGISGYQGLPLGVQVTQNVYGWGAGHLLENTLVLSLQIVNVSTDTLHDFIVASVSDPDMGQTSTDDIARYLDLRRSDRAYATYSLPGGPDRDSSSLVVSMLEGPVADENGVVDLGRRAEFREEGAPGSVWIRKATQEVEPLGMKDRYQRIATPQIDDTDTGEIRLYLATKPVTLPPGDTALVSYGFLFFHSKRPHSVRVGGETRYDIVGLAPLLDSVKSLLYGPSDRERPGVTISTAPCGPDTLDIRLPEQSSRTFTDLYLDGTTSEHSTVTYLIPESREEIAGLGTRHLRVVVAPESGRSHRSTAGVVTVDSELNLDTIIREWPIMSGEFMGSGEVGSIVAGDWNRNWALVNRTDVPIEVNRLYIDRDIGNLTLGEISKEWNPSGVDGPLVLPVGDSLVVNVSVPPVDSVETTVRGSIRATGTCWSSSLDLSAVVAPCLEVSGQDLGTVSAGSARNATISICNRGGGVLRFVDSSSSGGGVGLYISSSEFTVNGDDLMRLVDSTLRPGDCISVRLSFYSEKHGLFRAPIRFHTERSTCPVTTSLVAMIDRPVGVGAESSRPILELSIEPNPTRDKVEIRLPEYVGFGRLRVFDQLGQSLETRDLLPATRVVTISFSSYPTGTYFVRFDSGERRYLGSVIVR